MKRVSAFILLCSMIFTLQACTLLCRNQCRKVEMIPSACPGAPCGIFPAPCASARFPGFYRPDFGCIEKLRKLTALRQRGIGVIILGDRLRIILPADVVFTHASYDNLCGDLDVNDCHVSTLANIAEVIKCIPCVPVLITGHSDNVGTQQERYRRSRQLAHSVAAHLWAQGVEWDRLRIIPRADCDPISSDLSVFGSSDNRRVEIRLDFSRNYIFNCRYNNVYCPDCVGKEHKP